MALIHKGELEVELGLGLPKRTTTEREAYIPPSDGYTVYDTDLKSAFIWNATAQEWVGFVFGDKIDSLDGVGTNSFTINDVTDTSSIVISNALESSIIADNDFTIGKDSASDLNFTTTEITTTAPILGVDSTNPASLVTRDYVNDLVENNKFTDTFTTSDWVVSGSIKTITFPQTTHLLPIIANLTSYDVEVKQITNNIATAVSIESTVDVNTGEVKIITNGEVFNGVIGIRNN